MDDWDAPAESHQARRVDSRSYPADEALARAADALTSATNPMLVVGGGVDRAGAWDAAVRLAECLRLPVWEAPAPERASFPQDHQLYQGTLPLAMKPLADRLQGHDVVLVAGAPIFRYYPHIPGPILPPGTRLIHITDDAYEAARAPAGDSIVGDVRVALERLALLVPEADRPYPKSRPAPATPVATDPIRVSYAMNALAGSMPAHTLIVEESASSRAAFYDQIRISQPSSYFATASGGLGFALPAAVGVGLARPGSPVACIVGDGAAMFGIQAIWTAARYEIPVVYIVIDNGHYGILKAFAEFQRTPGVPGLDLPGLDVAMVARGLGAEARRITVAEDLHDAYQDAFQTAATQRCPVLLDVIVDPEVSNLFGNPD